MGFFIIISKNPQDQNVTNKHITFFRIFSLIAFFTLSSGADTLVVRGMVTKERSDTVIRNARVLVTSSQAGGSLRQDSAYTDALGQYEIVTLSVSFRITLSVSAKGFQSAENIVDIAAPRNGVSDTVMANFGLRPSQTAVVDTTRISGIIADARDHHSLARASIIVRGFSGVGGVPVLDTVYSDPSGRFSMMLLEANLYYQSITVEKNGYRPVGRLLPTGSKNIQLDTIFLVKLTPGDTITYTLSGKTSDKAGVGISGAMVSITLSQGGMVVFSGRDTSSRWGGYYSVSTREQYLTNDMTVRVRAVLDGYYVRDTVQTFPSSTQDIVINLVLEKNGSAVLPAGHVLIKAPLRRAILVTVDGRCLGAPATPAAQHRAAGCVIERAQTAGDAGAQKIVRLK
jgi:hypothetical protein